MRQRWRSCFSGGDVRVGGPVPEEPEPEPEPEVFSFAAPLPPWPPGGGFARGRMRIGGGGELELAAATAFQKICTLSPRGRGGGGGSGVTFYRPVGVPAGFSLLGYYCQPNCRPLHGHVLVARATGERTPTAASPHPPPPPPLCKPLDYALLWEFHAAGNAGHGRSDAYFWVPVPPEGYWAMGCVVTTARRSPPLDEVACVRDDLTDECEPHGSPLLCLPLPRPPPSCFFTVQGVRPARRGVRGEGVCVGTFFCCAAAAADGQLPPREHGMACLRNPGLDLSAMPTLEQAHAVVRHYGPTLFFHPKEAYLPSSVSWFFKNGAALYRRGGGDGEEIVGEEGSNLPGGGCNDGEYWIDVPSGERGRAVCRGSIESAELYAHVKPANGGACTDVAMWVFCPFNGPAMLKLGPISVPLGKTGRHVGDWEHFTLRVSNLTGELTGVYFSQHSGGHWVDASALEYVDGNSNRPAVYSSRNGHACYAYPGVYLQGSAALGVGIRNDAARSGLLVDSSARYRIVAAEYLGEEGGVVEPQWLQFMRAWGPTVVYKSRRRMEWMVGRLPPRIRCRAESMLNKMPNELSREEGPTGPKEKNNWEGDERW